MPPTDACGTLTSWAWLVRVIQAFEDHCLVVVILYLLVYQHWRNPHAPTIMATTVPITSFPGW